jgi:hypothetical protein
LLGVEAQAPPDIDALSVALVIQASSQFRERKRFGNLAAMEAGSPRFGLSLLFICAKCPCGIVRHRAAGFFDD